MYHDSLAASSPADDIRKLHFTIAALQQADPFNGAQVLDSEVADAVHWLANRSPSEVDCPSRGTSSHVNPLFPFLAQAMLEREGVIRLLEQRAAAHWYGPALCFAPSSCGAFALITGATGLALIGLVTQPTRT